MKQFSQAFQDHLDSRATTLCFCWIVTRLDGEVFPFTDLDRGVNFLGIDFMPNPGFTTTADESSLKLTVNSKEVSGFTDATFLTAEDIANGLWAGATVDCFCVNYEDTGVFHYESKSTIGNVTTSDIAFTFELVGLMQQLNLSVGRIYQRLCPESLGSTRCGVDLTASGNHGAGTITSVNGLTYTASGLGAFATGAFSNGKITFSDGQVVGVKSHTLTVGVATLVTWSVLNTTPTVGETFVITVGCDKAINSPNGCAKFSNRLNHRGFKLIPNNDSVTNYPVLGSSDNSGLSLFS